VDSFAFIIHPIDPRRDIQRKYPLLGRLATDWMIHHLSPLWPPVYLSEIEGITSAATGKQIKGWLIACPLSPMHFLGLPEKQVYRKIIETGRLAEKLGANLLGLGAFTSVVGDGGLTIASALDIPVTTGDAYTIAVAVSSLLEAARLMEIQVASTQAAVVGASGAIGKVCAQLLAGQVASLTLIGKQLDRLQALKDTILEQHPQVNLKISTEMKDLRQAQLILTVTSAIEAIIRPEHIRSGAVICDVARPRDVARQVAQTRQDVLVIDGGMVDVPGPVDFHFNFGFPPGKAYACMAETMALTLEGRFADYTVGKDIQLSRVLEIEQIASRHGFCSNGFRSFEQPVTLEQIQKVRENASKNVGTLNFSGGTNL
jgi:predicted amino acid dehydrogenase